MWCKKILVLIALILACCETRAADDNSGRGERTPQIAGEPVIRDARVVGDRISIPRMGDLWMNTWDDDDALYFGWGDGAGMTNCWPLQYDSLEVYGEVPPVIKVSPGLYKINPICFTHEDLCGFTLICSQVDCQSAVLPICPITDFGMLRMTGPVPDFEPCGANDCVVSRHIPASDLPPFSVVEGKNDKPSSLLFVDNRLYAAIHNLAGEPTYGFIAYSDNYGARWTEVQNSPWDSTSNFRVLMFINMGQAYNLNADGYVYGLGIPAEAKWGTQMAVYLTRVRIPDVANYSTYEYFTGLDSADQPGWSSNQSEAKPVPGLDTQEQGSAIFHEGTERYLFLTTKTGDRPSGVFIGGLFEALTPWGPWVQVADVFEPGNNPSWNDGGAYIPGLITKGAGPNSVLFTLAGGDDHYNLSIGLLELDTGPSTAVEDETILPQRFELLQNFPNPFNPETTIRYVLPKDSDVTVSISNLLGQEIITLLSNKQAAGEYQIRWNGLDFRGNNVSSGIYIVNFLAGSFVQSRKILLLK